MEWVEPLRGLGAEVICFDTIEIQPVEPDADELKSFLDVAGYDGVVFTSSNAVHRAVELWTREGGSTADLVGVLIIAVGARTCAALQEHGISADLVPKTFNQDGILQALEGRPLNGKRFLFPRARRVRAVLSKAFPGLGAELRGIVLYETAPRGPRESDDHVLSFLDDQCFVTFTSPSTVRGWFSLVGDDRGRRILNSARVVALGSTTSAALTGHGIVNHVTSGSPSLEGMVQAIEALRFSSN
jgi:uroporphyrinogen-III synthase